MSSSIILASSGAVSSGALSSGAASPLAASFSGAPLIILVIAHEGSIISTQKKVFSQVHLFLQCGNIFIPVLDSIHKILDFFVMFKEVRACLLLQFQFMEQHPPVYLRVSARLDLPIPDETLQVLDI